MRERHGHKAEVVWPDVVGVVWVAWQGSGHAVVGAWHGGGWVCCGERPWWVRDYAIMGVFMPGHELLWWRVIMAEGTPMLWWGVVIAEGVAVGRAWP